MLRVKLRSLAGFASVVPIVVGTLTLLGWLLNIPLLLRGLPGLTPIRANTALAFVLAGVALWLLRREGANPKARRLGQGCAAVVAAVGLLSLLESLFHLGLGMDHLLVREATGPVWAPWRPGRLAVITALNFTLLGLALLLLDVPAPKGRWFAQLLSITALLAALLVLVGYLYRVNEPYSIGRYVLRTLSTAGTFLVLALGLLLARPDRGIVWVLQSDTTGGMLARRLIPAVVSVPLVLGWLQLRGQQAGLYDTAFGAAIFAITSIAVLAAIVLWSASFLIRADAERRRAEVTLRQQASLLEQTHDAIFVWEFPGPVVYWNRAAERLFGFTRQEAVGQVSYRLLQSVFPHNRAEFEAALEREGEWIGELIHTRKNGERITVESRIRLMTEGDGKRLVLETSRDITERKRVEGALQEAHTLRQTITDNATIGIFMADGQNCCTFMNPAAEAMVGYTFAEIAGRGLHEVIHHHRPDGRPFPISECAIGQSVLQLRALRRHEDVLVRRDGTFFPVLCNASPITKDGVLTDVILEVRDITEEKRAAEALRRREAEFRQLADAMPQIVWTARADGYLDYYNERWYEFTGFPRGQGGDASWEPILHPDDRPLCRDVWYNAVRTGQPYQIEYRFQDRRTGDFRWFLGRALPVQDEAGQVVRWFGTCTDINDQKQAEEALKEANRRKDEFLAMLAHELRNPLTPIRTGLHILRMKQANGATIDQVQEMMEQQVHHLTRLVDDLLDVSRITRGKIALRKETVDLAAGVGHAVETVRPLLDSQHHRLTVALPPEAVHLEADPTRLEQILVNLLNNAAKYTRPGGHVSLTGERGDGTVVIRVRDTGVGMAADLLPKVFDLFTQADRTLDRSQGGLGIGLTLVHRLVQLHGGSVEAHSEGPGQGSEFVVRLPALPEPPSEPEAVREEIPRRDEALRVLVVEDDTEVAQMLKVLLELWGHEVRVVCDGPTALVADRTCQPEVVLLDIGLPGMNGYEVARQLRQQPGRKRPLLVAVTGYGSEEDKRLARGAGFDLHLTKPIDPDQLEALLARLQTSGPASCAIPS
jgi:PAS domain S-box-containing protein